MHMALEQAKLQSRFPNVTVRVPWTLAISTSVFDEFMEKSDLFDFALNEVQPVPVWMSTYFWLAQHGNTNAVIAQTFLQAPLPKKVIEDITLFCRYASFPLMLALTELTQPLQICQRHPSRGPVFFTV